LLGYEATSRAPIALRVQRQVVSLNMHPQCWKSWRCKIVASRST